MNGPIITYHPTTHSDIPVVLEMMEEFYEHENIPFEREKSEKTLEDFISKKDIGKIWILKIRDVAIGYICLVFGYTLEYYGHDCFLDEIYIKSSFRHQGIGTKVLEFLENYAQQQGIKAIHLFVFDKNKRAYDFYLHNGFSRREGSLMVKLIDQKP